MNLEDFIDWFEIHSAVPDDEDEVFVLRYAHQSSKIGKPDPQKLHKSVFTFNCVLGTKRLLRNGINATVLHADSTYKLNWEGYPVLVFGTTDRNKAFHPIVIAFSSNETAADYKFCIETIVESLQKIFNKNSMFQTLVSDAAPAIKNGFSDVFPNQDLIQCYFHVSMNIKKTEKIKKVDNRTSILRDLSQLQLSPSQDMFTVGAGLFLAKWQKKEPEFTAYFKKQWLSKKNANWFEGAKKFCPKTNNALESFNAKIKNDFYFREKSTMPQFQKKMFDMIRHMSCEYRDRIKEMKNKVEIRKQIWLDGHEWAASKTQVQVEDPETSPGETTYRFSEREENISQNAVDLYENKKFKDFSQFVEIISSVRVLVFKPTNQQNDKWRAGTCTCGEFFKNYLCKHVVGMSLRIGYLEMPPDLEQVSQKKKRGRPAKPGPALSLS